MIIHNTQNTKRLYDLTFKYQFEISAGFGHYTDIDITTPNVIAIDMQYYVEHINILIDIKWNKEYYN